MERNCLRNASPWDARRAAQGSPGAAASGAFWGLFLGEKSPAGGQGKGCRHASAAPAAETADATLAADSRPYGWRSRPGRIRRRDFGPIWHSLTTPQSRFASQLPLRRGAFPLRHPALCGRQWFIRHGGLRADVGIVPYRMVALEFTASASDTGRCSSWGWQPLPRASLQPPAYRRRNRPRGPGQ